MKGERLMLTTLVRPRLSLPALSDHQLQLRSLKNQLEQLLPQSTTTMNKLMTVSAAHLRLEVNAFANFWESLHLAYYLTSEDLLAISGIRTTSGS